MEKGSIVWRGAWERVGQLLGIGTLLWSLLPTIPDNVPEHRERQGEGKRRSDEERRGARVVQSERPLRRSRGREGEGEGERRDGAGGRSARGNQRPHDEAVLSLGSSSPKRRSETRLRHAGPPLLGWLGWLGAQRAHRATHRDHSPEPSPIQSQ